MGDDMYFSTDERSLHRGKRIAPRTDTCRPCIVHTLDKEKLEVKGVVLDINPHGMLVRMMEEVPVGSQVTIQLMRDDNFKEPFSSVNRGQIMRHIWSAGGFTDHGIHLEQKEVRRQESKPITLKPKRPSAPRKRTRMHTIDRTVGGPPQGRSRR